jgi:hypothetical protein
VSKKNKRGMERTALEGIVNELIKRNTGVSQTGNDGENRNETRIAAMISMIM